MRHVGANLDVDVSWKYLQFFMEDDERLKEIGQLYGSGSMLTGEIKAELIKVTCCNYSATAGNLAESAARLYDNLCAPTGSTGACCQASRGTQQSLKRRR